MFLKSGGSWLLCIWLSDLMCLPETGSPRELCCLLSESGYGSQAHRPPLGASQFLHTPSGYPVSSVEACPSKVRALSAAFLIVFWGTVLQNLGSCLK